MGRKIVVEDGESIDHALFRLRNKQAYEFKRWTKKRYGYYQKPSALRRKREKMASIWQLMQRSNLRWRRNGKSCQNAIHLFLGLKEMFARTGPINEAGR